MSSTQPLFGSKIKIARANRHIRELESLFDAFFCDNPHRIRINKHPDQGIAISAEFDRPLPNETAAIIGDVVHNLRAALDHLACDMIRASGENPNRWHGFPIDKSQSGFEGNIAGKLKGAADKFVDFVKSQRPYRDNGGNAWMHNLASLDNDDKHIVLIPTVGVASLKNIHIKNPDGTTMITMKSLDVSGDGHVNVARFGGAGLEIESDRDATLTVRFDQRGPLERHNVMEVLAHFSGGVDVIVRDASKLF